MKNFLKIIVYMKESRLNLHYIVFEKFLFDNFIKRDYLFFFYWKEFTKR